MEIAREENVLQLILIEDNSGDARVIERSLENIDAEYTIRCRHFEDPSILLNRIQDISFDVLLLDYKLGLTNGIETIKKIRDAGCERPIIMLTGKGDQDLAAEAMKTGASDYIPKSSISSERLHEAIETSYESYRRQQTQARRQQQLKESAFKDDVTGLGNLNYLRMRLRRVLKDPDVKNVAVLLIGIENMGMIHASLGKEVGDKLRRRIGQLMQDATREGDTVGRYRGDIFCAIFPGLTRETASQKADRVLDDLRGEGNSEIEGPLKSLDYRASLVERASRKEGAKEVFARALEQLDTLRCGNEGGISIGF